MDDAFFMGRGKALGDLEGIVHRFLQRERMIGKKGAQRGAVEKFGYDEIDAILRTDVEDGEEIRVT